MRTPPHGYRPPEGNPRRAAQATNHGELWDSLSTDATANIIAGFPLDLIDREETEIGYDRAQLPGMYWSDIPDMIKSRIQALTVEDMREGVLPDRELSIPERPQVAFQRYPEHGEFWDSLVDDSESTPERQFMKRIALWRHFNIPLRETEYNLRWSELRYPIQSWIGQIDLERLRFIVNNVGDELPELERGEPNTMLWDAMSTEQRTTFLRDVLPRALTDDEVNRAAGRRYERLRQPLQEVIRSYFTDAMMPYAPAEAQQTVRDFFNSHDQAWDMVIQQNEELAQFGTAWSNTSNAARRSVVTTFGADADMASLEYAALSPDLQRFFRLWFTDQRPRLRMPIEERFRPLIEVFRHPPVSQESIDQQTEDLPWLGDVPTNKVKAVLKDGLVGLQAYAVGSIYTPRTQVFTLTNMKKLSYVMKRGASRGGSNNLKDLLRQDSIAQIETKKTEGLRTIFKSIFKYRSGQDQVVTRDDEGRVTETTVVDQRFSDNERFWIRVALCSVMRASTMLETRPSNSAEIRLSTPFPQITASVMRIIRRNWPGDFTDLDFEFQTEMIEGARRSGIIRPFFFFSPMLSKWIDYTGYGPDQEHVPEDIPVLDINASVPSMEEIEERMPAAEIRSFMRWDQLASESKFRVYMNVVSDPSLDLEGRRARHTEIRELTLSPNYAQLPDYIRTVLTYDEQNFQRFMESGSATHSRYNDIWDSLNESSRRRIFEQLGLAETSTANFSSFVSMTYTYQDWRDKLAIAVALSGRGEDELNELAQRGAEQRFLDLTEDERHFAVAGLLTEQEILYPTRLDVAREIGEWARFHNYTHVPQLIQEMFEDEGCITTYRRRGETAIEEYRRFWESISAAQRTRIIEEAGMGSALDDMVDGWVDTRIGPVWAVVTVLSQHDIAEWRSLTAVDDMVPSDEEAVLPDQYNVVGARVAFQEMFPWMDQLNEDKLQFILKQGRINLVAFAVATLLERGVFTRRANFRRGAAKRRLREFLGNREVSGPTIVTIINDRNNETIRVRMRKGLPMVIKTGFDGGIDLHWDEKINFWARVSFAGFLSVVGQLGTRGLPSDMAQLPYMVDFRVELCRAAELLCAHHRIRFFRLPREFQGELVGAMFHLSKKAPDYDVPHLESFLTTMHVDNTLPIPDEDAIIGVLDNMLYDVPTPDDTPPPADAPAGITPESLDFEGQWGALNDEQRFNIIVSTLSRLPQSDRVVVGQHIYDAGRVTMPFEELPSTVVVFLRRPPFTVLQSIILGQSLQDQTVAWWDDLAELDRNRVLSRFELANWTPTPIHTWLDNTRILFYSKVLQYSMEELHDIADGTEVPAPEDPAPWLTRNHNERRYVIYAKLMSMQAGSMWAAIQQLQATSVPPIHDSFLSVYSSLPEFLRQGFRSQMSARSGVETGRSEYISIQLFWDSLTEVQRSRFFDVTNSLGITDLSADAIAQLSTLDFDDIVETSKLDVAYAYWRTPAEERQRAVGVMALGAWNNLTTSARYAVIVGIISEMDATGRRETANEIVETNNLNDFASMPSIIRSGFVDADPSDLDEPMRRGRRLGNKVKQVWDSITPDQRNRLIDALELRETFPDRGEPAGGGWGSMNWKDRLLLIAPAGSYSETALRDYAREEPEAEEPPEEEPQDIVEYMIPALPSDRLPTESPQYGAEGGYLTTENNQWDQVPDSVIEIIHQHHLEHLQRRAVAGASPSDYSDAKGWAVANSMFIPVRVDDEEIGFITVVSSELRPGGEDWWATNVLQITRRARTPYVVVEVMKAQQKRG